MALGGQLDVSPGSERGLQASTPSFRSRRRGACSDAEPVRVLLVDDHAVVREGYRTLIEKHEGLRSSARPATPRRPISATRTRDRMSSSWTSRCRGAAASMRSSTSAGSTRKRAFSSSPCMAGAAYALQAFRAGAKGYVTKSSPPELLVSAVRDVAERPRRHLSGDQRAACPRSGARGERTAWRIFRRASSRFSA